MKKAKIQLVEKQINGIGQSVRISETLDASYDKLTGIAVLWTAGTGHEFISSSINGEELFPKGFELEFLQSNTYVAPNQRFFKLNEIAKGNKLELEFKDGRTGEGGTPYVLKIYLLLENE